MPGPTQEATVEPELLAPAPITDQVACTTWGFLLFTGTTKSKLCADSVLKTSSKSQSGFGPVQTPVPTPPVGLLQVTPVPVQSAVVVQAPKVAWVHCVSCEKS